MDSITILFFHSPLLEIVLYAKIKQKQVLLFYPEIEKIIRKNNNKKILTLIRILAYQAKW